jgi:hypothetical protein
VAAATQDSAIPDSAPAAGAVPVTMKEYSVDAPTALKAGSITFTLTNNGEFDHELVVAKGDSYETLPHLDNGAVDEDALGADLIGRGKKIGGGSSDSVTMELPAGKYVLFCNLGNASNSHAAKGQVLSVTVS